MSASEQINTHWDDKDAVCGNDFIDACERALLALEDYSFFEAYDSFQENIAYNLEDLSLLELKAYARRIKFLIEIILNHENT